MELLINRVWINRARPVAVVFNEAWLCDFDEGFTSPGVRSAYHSFQKRFRAN